MSNQGRVLTYSSHRELTPRQQQGKCMMYFLIFLFPIFLVYRFGTTNILIAIAGIGSAFLVLVVCMYDVTGHNVEAMAQRILGDYIRSRRGSSEPSQPIARIRDDGRYSRFAVICPICSHTIAHPELPDWPYIRCNNCGRVIQLKDGHIRKEEY